MKIEPQTTKCKAIIVYRGNHSQCSRYADYTGFCHQHKKKACSEALKGVRHVPAN